jgi:integrase
MSFAGIVGSLRMLLSAVDGVGGDSCSARAVDFFDFAAADGEPSAVGFSAPAAVSHRSRPSRALGTTSRRHALRGARPRRRRAPFGRAPRSTAPPAARRRRSHACEARQPPAARWARGSRQDRRPSALRLRRGEICGLRQCDVDLRRRQIKVEQAEWKGIVDSPKSGRGRIIPMTDALHGALAKNRHLSGKRVLTLDDGSPVPGHVLRDWIKRAQRRAGLEATGNVHILRHTFCSHLAMRGAPAKAIQELAGHQHLSTTLRYMHLSPTERTRAIDLLNERASYGNLTATAAGQSRN